MRTIVLFSLAIAAAGCGPSQPPASVPPPPAAVPTVTDKPTAANNGVLKDLLQRSGAVVYPGADLPEGESNIRDAADRTAYELVMITPDSQRKVADFYRKAMNVQGGMERDHTILMGTQKNNNVVMISIFDFKGKTKIQLVTEAPKAKSVKG